MVNYSPLKLTMEGVMWKIAMNLQKTDLINLHIHVSCHTIKGKVKLSLCLTKHYAMKMYGGVDI
jgi:hypothetical protein